MRFRDTLAMRLRHAYFPIRRLTRARLAEFDITVDQFVVLSLLVEQQGRTQQNLVEEASSDPSTMRAMLVLLEERGLIRREYSTHDARARLVFLTSQGRKLQEKLLADGPQQVPSYLDGVLTDDELTTLLRCLDKIADAADSAERSPERKQRSRESAQAVPFTKKACNNYFLV